ncbi:hypothetical protein EOL96_01070 [Candidatus Saccharibacteria bacterium]|nr:hypothetical protein [Candidatus Saccharibacteria bacterium]
MNILRLRTTLRHLWYRYATMNNIVMAVGVFIAIGWAWGSITTMQRNFALQREVDAQSRQLELTSLEVETLQYQQNYYRSDEYKDLSAREHLGLASPDEKVLLLPPNSDAAKRDSLASASTDLLPLQSRATPTSNFDQWMNFLLGGAAAG